MNVACSFERWMILLSLTSGEPSQHTCAVCNNMVEGCFACQLMEYSVRPGAFCTSSDLQDYQARQASAGSRVTPHPDSHRDLGREPLGVAREQGRLADVVQAQEQHDHALQPHAEAAVRERAVPERVDVRLDGLQRDLVRARALCRDTCFMGWVYPGFMLACMISNMQCLKPAQACLQCFIRDLQRNELI